MSFGSRKIVALLALSSFLLVVFLSLIMMHEADGSMPGDCPLSTASTVLCPFNTLNIAANHISAYRDFVNVLISIGVILAVSFVYFQFIIVSLTQRFIYGVILEVATHDRTTISWLSLLENSPSR